MERLDISDLSRKDNRTCSLMSSWTQPATSVFSTGWLDVFTRLQLRLLLCSGIYKNSPVTTKRCQAWAPENTGYLISATKVSQAEFCKKLKVAKLVGNYKACDCPSASCYISNLKKKRLSLHYLLLELTAEHWFSSTAMDKYWLLCLGLDEDYNWLF